MKSHQHFERLVLGFMDSYDSERENAAISLKKPPWLPRAMRARLDQPERMKRELRNYRKGKWKISQKQASTRTHPQILPSGSTDAHPHLRMTIPTSCVFLNDFVFLFSQLSDFCDFFGAAQRSGERDERKEKERQTAERNVRTPQPYGTPT